MTWIGLGNPRPDSVARRYDLFVWADGDVTQLSPGRGPTNVDSGDLLGSRRTRRTFSEIDMTQLSSLLWLTCRIQETLPSSLGFPLSLRPTPSAGAIHPIHVLVQMNTSDGWRRYDPLHHALLAVRDSEASAAAARLEACEALDPQQGVLFGFAAEPGKTAAKYLDASSLVWRDAGVLLGYLSVAAEALCLNFCPLGLTGDASIGSLDEQGRLVGVGLALLGGR